MRRVIVSVLAAAMLAVVGWSAAAPAVAAKKYTACVKKSTGEVRLLLGTSKKCGKGWKKTSWTKAGPRGSKGTVGPNGRANTFGDIVDGNGAVVGELVGSYVFPVAVFFIKIDGGIWIYYPNGWLVPIGANVYYDNATCTGTPFTVAEDATLRDAALANPSMRLVERTTTPTGLGPAKGFKPDGTSTSVINLNRWYISGPGTCTAQGTYTGFRLPLTPVQAPPDFPGPLALR